MDFEYERIARTIECTMERKILVLDDGTPVMATLIERLLANGFQVRRCTTAEDVFAGESSHLVIAKGTGMDLAEEVYQRWTTPTILILNTAGDMTQASLRRHPGVIGVYYSPLNVEKLFERTQKFFASIGL